MCGSSKSQNDINEQQIQFMKTMQDQYQQEFQQNEDILHELTANLQPIVTAGPEQYGFSEAEEAALNTEAMESAANEYTQTATAVGEHMAAEGGGDEFIPSGAEAQVQAGIAENAESTLAKNKLDILKTGYGQGNENFRTALGALSGAPGSTESPLAALAGETTRSGSAAADEANAITAANTSWMGVLGGVLGNVAGGLSGGLSKRLFGSK